MQCSHIVNLVEVIMQYRYIAKAAYPLWLFNKCSKIDLINNANCTIPPTCTENCFHCWVIQLLLQVTRAQFVISGELVVGGTYTFAKSNTVAGLRKKVYSRLTLKGSYFACRGDECNSVARPKRGRNHNVVVLRFVYLERD